MAKIRSHLFISGLVQGVYFRGSMRREAELGGVNGWVRNLPDGRVEAVVEGEQEDVSRLIAWAQHGPANATVEHVDVEEGRFMAEFGGFVLR